MASTIKVSSNLANKNPCFLYLQSLKYSECNLINVFFKIPKLILIRSLVLKYLDDPGGLSEIAARAKRNVKRNYGKDSPEYKALVNKAY